MFFLFSARTQARECEVVETKLIDSRGVTKFVFCKDGTGIYSTTSDETCIARTCNFSWYFNQGTRRIRCESLKGCKLSMPTAWECR